MFTGGVKFNTSVVFLTKVVVACHIYSWFLSMWWVLSLSILLSICRVYIYKADHVELPVILFGILHAVQMKRSSACRVIVEVLVCNASFRYVRVNMIRVHV